jgi:tetratricopeptide (TPR) repeat protein
MRRFCLYFLFFTISSALKAQENLSASQHIASAEKAYRERQYEKAAAHYEAAWSKKPKKLEWLYESGNLYFKIREYGKAAEAFSILKNNKHFPKARLYYAMSLQQSGQYDEAVPEFLLYLNSYEGSEREQVAEKIEEYINGCSLAIRLSATKNDSIEITHLNSGVNTTENEVAPLPFNDDIVYFTAIKNGQAKIYRSQNTGNEWTNAALANLPMPDGVSYGNGAFSADGTRFYYTQCQTVKTKKEEYLTCGIYVVKRTNQGWSEPIRLPETINTEGGITTQPTIFEKDGKEYLFFASDRKGSYGGMDLWQASRFLKKEEFSAAVNLGMPINTEGDEASPFYDVTEGVLYFSSNGRATFGGLDIFKSKGFNRQWFVPENMGIPFNSGADDWYFIKNKSHTGGFFVSNRPVGMEKIGSRDDDIFSFSVKEHTVELAAHGKIFEKESNRLIENARVSLFEKRERGEPRLLSSIMATDGNFNFIILPQKRYTIEVEKEGFRLATIELSTKDSLKNVSRDFYLDKYGVLASYKTDMAANTATVRVNEKPGEVHPQKTVDTQQVKNNTQPTINNQQQSTISPPSVTNVEKVEKPDLKDIKKIKNGREKGVSYKIQLMAFEEMSAVHNRRLSRVDDLGDLDMEKITLSGKKYTRALLAGFETYEGAVAALKKVKSRSLNDAFIVRYENGVRTNKMR